MKCNKNGQHPKHMLKAGSSQSTSAHLSDDASSNLLIISGTSACKLGATTNHYNTREPTLGEKALPLKSSNTSGISKTARPHQHSHPKLLNLSTHSDMKASSDETAQEAQQLLNQWTIQHNVGKYFAMDSDQVTLQPNNLISNIVTGNSSSMFKNVSSETSTTTENTPSNYLERVKSKKPSQLSQWEKLRISMERKKQPTLQLVDNIEECKNTNMSVNNLWSPTCNDLRKDEKHESSLFQYKPLSECISDQSTTYETQNYSTGVLLTTSNTPVKDPTMSDSVEQQLQAFRFKLLGKDYKMEEKTVSKKPSVQKTQVSQAPSKITDTAPKTNYITSQKEIFIAENEKRIAEEEVQKIKRQLEEEKNKLKQVQQMKQQELKTIQQHQQIKDEMEKVKQQQLKVLKEHEKERTEMLQKISEEILRNNNLTLKSKIFNLWMKKSAKRFQLLLKAKTLFQWKVKKKAFKALYQNCKLKKEVFEKQQIEKMLLLEKKRNQAADQFYRSRSLSSCFLKWVCQYKIARDRKIIERQHLRRRDMMNHFIEKMKKQQEEVALHDTPNHHSVSSLSCTTSDNNNINHHNNTNTNNNNNTHKHPNIKHQQRNDHAGEHKQRQVLKKSTKTLQDVEESMTNLNNSNENTITRKNEENILHGLPSNLTAVPSTCHGESLCVVEHSQNHLTSHSEPSIQDNNIHVERIASSNQVTMTSSSPPPSCTSNNDSHEKFTKKHSHLPQTPSFLKAMEERVNERKERWKQLQEKYKLQEESKEKLKQEEEKKKLEEELERKKALLEEKRREKELLKQKALEQELQRQENIQKREKAHNHYLNTLARNRILKPLKRLVQQVQKKEREMDHIYHLKLVKLVFIALRANVMEELELKRVMKQQCIDRRIEAMERKFMSRAFKGLKMNVKKNQQVMQDAIEHYSCSLFTTYFTQWKIRYKKTKERRLIRKYENNKKAEQFYEMYLLKRYFRNLQQAVIESRIQKEKEEQGKVLKEKVKHWLSDFRLKKDIDWSSSSSEDEGAVE
ncbi:hypothetical protein C9374_005105 [Naegleria lovaniensis]|uniref:Sfi1 spindle body domain-containing protein n=1 Tax=Naegleria lovaniensis TaxID=51637 RepID=A0AA88GLP4_NAELO|nr:uncharacterized protein C9374_005105 [Naegleria lovaniensis]KAG2382525.1 hypothetical protein C9374_005105 [Naegleria lovaniensis]